MLCPAGRTYLGVRVPAHPPGEMLEGVRSAAAFLDEFRVDGFRVDRGDSRSPLR